MARKFASLIGTINPATDGGGPYEFTDLGDFSSIYINAIGVTATTHSAGLFQPSADNGSTYDTDANNQWQFFQDGNSGFSQTVDGLVPFESRLASYGVAQIHNFNVAAPMFSVAANANGNTAEAQWLTGMNPDAVAYNAFRIIKTGNDFLAGEIQIWGERAPLELITTLSYPLTGDQTVSLAGYATVYIASFGSSAASLDYRLQMQLSGTPLTSSTAYPTNIWTGAGGSITHAVENSFYIHDGTSSTFQYGAGVIHGHDMAVPQVIITNNFANVSEQIRATFIDNNTAYNQLLSLDDSMNGGSVYFTGVPSS